jgi:hypothetical protein
VSQRLALLLGRSLRKLLLLLFDQVFEVVGTWRFQDASNLEPVSSAATEPISISRISEESETVAHSLFAIFLLHSWVLQEVEVQSAFEPGALFSPVGARLFGLVET